MLLRFVRNNSIYHNFSFAGELYGDTDIPRLRKGLVGGQFWSVFVPWYLTISMNTHLVHVMQVISSQR
jgi:hypothetical protein